MGISSLQTFDSFDRTNFEYILHACVMEDGSQVPGTAINGTSTMASGLMFIVTTSTISSLVNFTLASEHFRTKVSSDG